MPAEGWAAPPVEWHVLDASPRARSLQPVVPVPRVFTARVRVLRADGSPAAGADVVVDPVVSVAPWAGEARTDAEGVALVRGLPFHRGEVADAEASLAVDEDEPWWASQGESEPARLVDPDRVVELTVHLAEEPVDPRFEGPRFSGTIGIGGSGDARADGDPPTRGRPRLSALSASAHPHHGRVAWWPRRGR